MGPLVSLAQRDEVLERLAELAREADIVVGAPVRFGSVAPIAERGAFLPPLLCAAATRTRREPCTRSRRSGRWRRCCRTRASRMRSHSRGAAAEAWRPRCSAADDAVAAHLVLGLAPFHGRILVVNARCAKNRPATARRSRPWCTAARAAPAAARKWAASAACCTTCSARRCRAPRHDHRDRAGRWVRGSRQLDPGRASVPHAFHELRLGRHVQFGRARGHGGGHRALRGAVGRQLLRAHERGRGGAQSAVRRSCRARIFSDLRRRGTVRRPRLRPRARQLRPERAAVRQAGQARGPDQGAAHLRTRRACGPTRAGARWRGTPRSPTRTGKPWLPTTCLRW